MTVPILDANHRVRPPTATEVELMEGMAALQKNAANLSKRVDALEGKAQWLLKCIDAYNRRALELNLKPRRDLSEETLRIDNAAYELRAELERES